MQLHIFARRTQGLAPRKALAHLPLHGPSLGPVGRKRPHLARKGSSYMICEYFMVLSVNNKNEITLKYNHVWAAGQVNESSRSQMRVPLIEA